MLIRSERISQYIRGRTLQDFQSDQQFQDAVLHNVLILGEAASRIDAETRVRYPLVPWRQITGIRNHIVHGYTRLDLQIIWHAVEHDVPSLLDELLQILPPEHS